MKLLSTFAPMYTAKWYTMNRIVTRKSKELFNSNMQDTIDNWNSQWKGGK